MHKGSNRFYRRLAQKLRRISDTIDTLRLAVAPTTSNSAPGPQSKVAAPNPAPAALRSANDSSIGFSDNSLSLSVAPENRPPRMAAAISTIAAVETQAAVAAVGLPDPARFDGPRRPAPSPAQSFRTQMPLGLLEATQTASAGSRFVRAHSYAAQIAAESRAGGAAGGPVPQWAGAVSVTEAAQVVAEAQGLISRVARNTGRRVTSTSTSASPVAAANPAVRTSDRSTTRAEANVQGGSSPSGIGVFRRAASQYPSWPISSSLPDRPARHSVGPPEAARLTPSANAVNAAVSAALAALKTGRGGRGEQGLGGVGGRGGGGSGLDVGYGEHVEVVVGGGGQGTIGPGLVLVPRTSSRSPKHGRPVHPAADGALRARAGISTAAGASWPTSIAMEADGLKESNSAWQTTKLQLASDLHSIGHQAAVTPKTNGFHPAEGSSPPGQGLVTLSELWAGLGESARQQNSPKYSASTEHWHVRPVAGTHAQQPLTLQGVRGLGQQAELGSGAVNSWTQAQGHRTRSGLAQQ